VDDGDGRKHAHIIDDFVLYSVASHSNHLQDILGLDVTTQGL